MFAGGENVVKFDYKLVICDEADCLLRHNTETLRMTTMVDSSELLICIERYLSEPFMVVNIRRSNSTTSRAVFDLLIVGD